MTFRWFYDLTDVITLLAVVGVIRALLRRQAWTARFPLLLLILTVLIGAAGVIAWTIQTYASQGRLLFPYLAAISPLLAVGLVELLTLLGQRAVVALSRAFVIAAAVFALIVPVASIAPAYAPPPALAALPADAEPVYARFGDVALIGYQASDRRYQAGDVVPITVYWQVIAATTQDLSLYLHAVGSAEIGRRARRQFPRRGQPAHDDVDARRDLRRQLRYPARRSGRSRPVSASDSGWLVEFRQRGRDFPRFRDRRRADQRHARRRSGRAAGREPDRSLMLIPPRRTSAA